MRIPLLTLAALLTLGPAFPQDGRITAYKVELRISDSTDARREGSRLYTQVLDDGAKGTFRVGKKVAYNNNFVDVGMNVDFRVRERSPDHVLLADVDLDISTLEGANIQQIRMAGISRVTPGKAQVVASFQDPVLQRRMELEITVTRTN